MMFRTFFIAMGILLLPGMASAGIFDDFLQIVQQGAPAQSAQGDEGLASGLKEALVVGTGAAVQLAGRQDGYWQNEAIRIAQPAGMRKVSKKLRRAGLGAEVDAFELGMNRAAERAAPKAKAIFLGAIKEMSIQDAVGVFNGGNTAATEYFRQKTASKLAGAFKPEIAASMDTVGLAQLYKTLNAQVGGMLTLVNPDFDLDQYVTGKALDGLFYMLGQEEQKIRTDPAARTTEILRKVFGQPKK